MLDFTLFPRETFLFSLHKYFFKCIHAVQFCIQVFHFLLRLTCIFHVMIILTWNFERLRNITLDELTLLSLVSVVSTGLFSVHLLL